MENLLPDERSHGICAYNPRCSKRSNPTESIHSLVLSPVCPPSSAQLVPTSSFSTMTHSDSLATLATPSFSLSDLPPDIVLNNGSIDFDSYTGEKDVSSSLAFSPSQSPLPSPLPLPSPSPSPLPFT